MASIRKLGKVASIVRYPVKSMAGELVDRAYMNEHGLEHDRLYAFESSGAPPGMVRLTSRERREMLRYRPHVSPDGSVWVATPTGDCYPVDGKEMLNYLQERIPGGSRLSLIRGLTPQTDVRPFSLLSTQTVHAISSELGVRLDPQRFRTNLLLSMQGGAHTEDALAGRVVGIGEEARLLIKERIPRCRLITYDPSAPDIEEPLFAVMKLLERQHQGRVGVYASVLKPGWIQCGDELWEAGDPIDALEAATLRPIRASYSDPNTELLGLDNMPEALCLPEMQESERD